MSNRPWWNLEPCGTPAAYRRHLRHGQRPCERCRDAERLRQAGREDNRPAPRWNAARYAELRAAGMSRAAASKLALRREAA